MPHGRTTTLTVALTMGTRQTLEAWQRAQAIPAGQARRGRIILLVADGLPVSQVAARVGISRRFVYKWVARFQAQGLQGLIDLPRHAFPHRRRQTEAQPLDAAPGQA